MSATVSQLNAALPAGESALPPPARFNRRAQGYRQHAQVQRDMAAWLAQWLPKAGVSSASGAAALPAGKESYAAIDLGAGDGMFTRFLTPRFSRVTALDASAQMLEQGRAACPQADWVHGDAWTLAPLEAVAHDADWLTSSSLLQWCRQPREVLRRWARCYRAGTRMLHGFYVEPTLQEWRSVFGEGAIRWLSQEAWLEAFADTGWRVLRSECEVRPYRFANTLDLARSLHGTGVTPEHGRLGAGKYRALLRAYDERFAADAGCREPLFGSDAAEAKPHSGVVATWAFFRIEAELP